jgi:hypothetical protein
MTASKSIQHREPILDLERIVTELERDWNRVSQVIALHKENRAAANLHLPVENGFPR